MAPFFQLIYFGPDPYSSVAGSGLQSRLNKIHFKLIFLIGLIVFLTVGLVSSVIFVQVRDIIITRTHEICATLASQLSAAATEELLINEVYDSTRTTLAGMNQTSVAGLVHSYILNVNHTIVAHTSTNLVGNQALPADQEYFRSIAALELSELKTERTILRFAFPIQIEYRGQPLRVGTGVFEFDKAVILQPVETIFRLVLTISSALFALSLLLTYFLAQRISRPITELSSAARTIAQGELGLSVPVRSGDEIGQLAIAFNSMSQELKDSEKVKMEKAALSREMELARNIQLALLPPNGQVSCYEFLGFMETAAEVGGDYYDYLTTTKSRKEFAYFFVGDVSGHGLRSGLIMLMAQTALHTLQELNLDQVDQAFQTLNRILFQNIQRLKEQKYMTASLFRADETGHFNCAGLHQDLYIYRHKQKKVESIISTGMWLGVLEDIEEATPILEFRLEKNDLLFLYTDGVTETHTGTQELYGHDRLVQFLESNGHRDLTEIRTDLVQELAQFRAGAEMDDDITFALVRRT